MPSKKYIFVFADDDDQVVETLWMDLNVREPLYLIIIF